MKNILVLAIVVLLVLLVGLGAAGHNNTPSANTPAGGAQQFFALIQQRDFDAAYAALADPKPDRDAFLRDIAGSNASLRTVSTLQDTENKVVEENADTAHIRSKMRWSTAVGAISEERELEMRRQNGNWRLVWSVSQPKEGDLRAEKTDALRWDIVQRSESRDDWGAQNLEAPHMRIVSMNAIEKDGGVIIMGEVVNEDTIPGFITVNAALIGKNDQPLVEESSFDKISHALLPKEVSPFRVDFPNRKLSEIKSVRMTPTALLLPAAADPVIGVMNQRIEKDLNGHAVLKGELVNQSGKPVNIPHVLATFYDNAGRVIWVSDGYVQNALLPGSPVSFAVPVRDEVVPAIQNFRVTVNHYTSERSS